MERKPLIDTVAPTPFGWVITTQDNFDFSSMMAFRNQLVSLSRGLGASRTIQSVPAAAVAMESDQTHSLEPALPVRSA